MRRVATAVIAASLFICSAMTPNSPWFFVAGGVLMTFVALAETD